MSDSRDGVLNMWFGPLTPREDLGTFVISSFFAPFKERYRSQSTHALLLPDFVCIFFTALIIRVFLPVSSLFSVRIALHVNVF